MSACGSSAQLKEKAQMGTSPDTEGSSLVKWAKYKQTRFSSVYLSRNKLYMHVFCIRSNEGKSEMLRSWNLILLESFIPRETIGLQEATSGTLTHERRQEKASQSTHHKEQGKTYSFSKNTVSDRYRLIPGACSTPSERNSSDEWAERTPAAAAECAAIAAAMGEKRNLCREEKRWWIYSK